MPFVGIVAVMKAISCHLLVVLNGILRVENQVLHFSKQKVKKIMRCKRKPNCFEIDDRFLMKQMSKYELDAFLGFAPAYFQYMSEAFFSELPTVLAKILGFYSIGYKNSATGKSMRMDVLVMENLFYQRNVKKVSIFLLMSS